MSTAIEPAHPPAWARALRVVLSLAALAGLLYWALWFTVLFMFRCDENCSGGMYNSWRYPAQFGLGVLGFGLGVVALALGFTRRRTAYRVCLLGSTAFILTWAVWVLFFGMF